MKLLELGLKQQPQTKYFEGGYVSFSTSEGELSYSINMVGLDALDASVTIKHELEKGDVKDKEHLERLMSIKTINEVIQA